MSNRKNEKPQDTADLNQEAEDEMVAAQWEQAESLGLLDTHPDSINGDRPKG